jgi:hypothetical protein
MGIKFETYRYADVSTGHITHKDAELLEEHAKEGSDKPVGPIAYKYPEGFWVWLPSGEVDLLRTYLCRLPGGRGVGSVLPHRRGSDSAGVGIRPVRL